MKEEEIRPKKLFNEYLELCRQDVTTFFTDADKVVIDCPACGNTGDFIFDKHGFKYEECSACHTIYVSPRPISEAFDQYYKDSPSTRFWASTFYKDTLEARKEKMWKPKAGIIHRIIQERGIEPTIVDIGAGYGVFADVMSVISDFPLLLIEPSVHLSKILKEKGYTVLEQSLESITPNQIKGNQRCFVSFELFEHLHNPSLFLQKLFSIMRPNDLFIFTTLSSTGIDIQSLWQDSNAVSPPHHLNFFNPWSIRVLLEKEGFKSIDVSTPGKLDIDILANSQAQIKDRFLNTFINYASQEAMNELQTLISNHGFSSHMMVVCEKG